MPFRSPVLFAQLVLTALIFTSSAKAQDVVQLPLFDGSLVLRADDDLYDLRLNCEFKHLDAPDTDTNYAAIMHRYIDIAVPVPMPAASQHQEQADS